MTLIIYLLSLQLSLTLSRFYIPFLSLNLPLSLTRYPFLCTFHLIYPCSSPPFLSLYISLSLSRYHYITPFWSLHFLHSGITTLLCVFHFLYPRGITITIPVLCPFSYHSLSLSKGYHYLLSFTFSAQAVHFPSPFFVYLSLLLPAICHFLC